MPDDDRKDGFVEAGMMSYEFEAVFVRQHVKKCSDMSFICVTICTNNIYVIKLLTINNITLSLFYDAFRAHSYNYPPSTDSTNKYKYN